MKYLAPSIFVALYTISARHLDVAGVRPLAESLAVLVIFLGVLGGLAYLTTRRITPEPARVAEPGREAAAVLALVALVALWLTFGSSALDRSLAGALADAPVLAALVKLVKKLVAFVLVPYAVLRLAFGRRWPDFGLSLQSLARLWGRPGLAALVVGLAAALINLVIGHAAAPLRSGELSAGALLVGLPLCFAWNMAEVGLVEEFFFRALVQTRLAALCRSELAGAALMMLVFGLAHAPGLVLRGAGAMEGMTEPPSAWDAIAYTVTVQGIAGAPFAILWARTRNLWVVMSVHAAVDTIPHAASFIRLFGLG